MADDRNKSTGGLPKLGQTDRAQAADPVPARALIVYRIGTFIPVPGIDPVALQELFNQQRGTILDMFNMFSGGALQRFSVLALGIMPYISASIILQLLTSCTEARAAQEGRRARAAQDQPVHALRHGALATFQALGVAIALEGQQAAGGNVVIDPGLGFRVTAVVTLVTGTLFLMWLGEQVTERRHRQRYLDDHFRRHRAGLPGAVAARSSWADGRAAHAHHSVHARLNSRRHGLRRVRRARAAADHRELRQAPGRAAHVCGQTSHLPLKVNMSGVIPPNLRVEYHPVSLVGGRVVRHGEGRAG